MAPAAINVMFGSVEATVILSTGSSMSVMREDVYEQIKALPNARDIVREEGQSEYKYQGDAFRSPKQKILKAVSFNAVVSGAPILMRFHIVKKGFADGVLGTDFFGSLAEFQFDFGGKCFQWRQGTRTVKATLLDKPKLRLSKSEDGQEPVVVCAIRPFI